MYSKSFEDMFPPRRYVNGQWIDTSGFDQAIALDLMPYAQSLKRPTELVINLVWSDASPKSYYLYAFAVQQREISFDKNGWEYSVVPI